ncbi:MAG: GSCFA domain-containing protein [Rhodobacter sp.]|nr:GSCFA domain-containing protein [Rhodobacter sp.]
MSEVDPVVEARFRLTRTDRIATAGSCFAQHIARTIVSSDFNYFVSEKAPAGTSPDLAEARQFGLFSARFGNIYTTRQLVQLFERAYGRFRPKGDHWMGLDGGLIDPFRPTIEPSGFSSVEALHLDRETHFAAVRDMFENLDVFCLYSWLDRMLARKIRWRGLSAGTRRGGWPNGRCCLRVPQSYLLRGVGRSG